MKKVFAALFALLVLLSVASCGGSSAGEKGKDSTVAVVAKPTNHIQLDTIHSMLRSKDSTSVPVYEIVSADSFYIDMKGYDFYLPDPAFTYIRENISYKQELLGSFAYLYVYSGDSTISYSNMKTEKSADNNSILVKLKNKDIKEFKLGFMYYIDNGKGLQTIDKFKVKVASAK